MNVMKALFFLCALGGAAAAQVQLGGFRVGTSKKPQPPPSPPAKAADKPAQAQPQAPAEPDHRAATEAWRQVQRQHESRLARLYEYATRPPTGPIGTDQYARRALS